MLISSVFSTQSFAQQEPSDTLITNELEPVTVSAYRLETTDFAVPLSMTVVGKNQLKSNTQQLALDEVLNGVPGLFVQNGTNFAQDIRVSIRGFGSRSAFGIRGVKILVDGFPESTPDGTAQVDAIDPGTLTGVGIIRSGTGGLYGNASGGYINFNTLRFNEEESAELGATYGQYGFQKYQFRTGGGKANKFLYSINGAYTKTDGYRDHSTMKNYLVNGGFLVPIDNTLILRGALTYVNSPVAEDPGALTVDQVSADRKMARSTNLTFDAGESLWQLRAGLGVTKKIGSKTSLKANIYNTSRSFNARLPFDYIELERVFTGGNFSYGFKSKKWEITAGIDIESQADDRQRFNNESGKKGDLYVDQLEKFNNIGLYLVQKITIGKRFSLLPALRYDRSNIHVDDRYLEDGIDDSAKVDYNTFNPTLGLSFEATKRLYFFTNANRAYEIPTLQELFSDGSYNQSLKPQTSISVEVGMKALNAKNTLRAELSVFRIWLKDEFLAFTQVDGSTFLKNVGTSKRLGLEASLLAFLTKQFSTRLNLTLSKFNFVEYYQDSWDGIVDYSGNTLPGVPSHNVGLQLNYDLSNDTYLSLGVQQYGNQFFDNANSEKVNAYTFGTLRAGTGVKIKKTFLNLFLGVNNLFNQKYYANIRINTSSAFEPAPPFNIYGGFNIRI